MRKIFQGIGLFVVLLLLMYVYQTWENNRPVKTPDQSQLQTTLENAILWLYRNVDKILAVSNPFLWGMIQQAAEITDDKRLKSLFSAYNKRYHLESRQNIWRPLFYPGSWVSIRYQDIVNWDFDKKFFIYAILCDRELGNIPEIAEQYDPSFCDEHPITPTCATHQLMGFRFLQRSKCGDAKQLDNTVRQLQQRIRTQLIMDPRVVDVYMQRVLMLVESGASEMVKPVWIHNLIAAQQADGGWSRSEPLVPLMGGHYFGYGSKLFTIDQPRSHFHTTAQGVLLFSLLGSHKDTLYPSGNHTHMNE